MSAGGANSAQQPERPQDAARPSWLERAARAVRRGVLACIGAAVLGLGLGFVWFVWRVPDGEVELTRNAEGIVVLTGGASRVVDAIELLAAGRGQRLLITGVY